MGSLLLKLVEYLLYLLRYDKKCDENLKKVWKCSVRKKTKLYFQLFSSQIITKNPFKDFLSKKKQKIYSTYVLNKIKKQIFT
jgi:hypothetical protein